MEKPQEILKEDQNIKDDKKISIEHVSLQNFILFKEEFLQYLGDFKKEINSNMEKDQKKYQTLIENANKLINSLNIENTFLSKLKFIEEKSEIFSHIDKIDKDLANQIMLNKINLTACQKDLSTACFKYDKMITDNLLVPGVIGKSCKFPNLKEYLLKNLEEMISNSKETKKCSLEVIECKTKIENIYEQLKIQIIKVKNHLQAYIDLKVNELNDKFELFTRNITDKVNALNLENSNLVETLKEQETKMLEGLQFIERLKNETIESNIKTSAVITKSNKNYINQFIQAKNEFKSMKKNVLDLSLLLTKKDNDGDKNKKNKSKNY